MYHSVNNAHYTILKEKQSFYSTMIFLISFENRRPVSFFFFFLGFILEQAWQVHSV